MTEWRWSRHPVDSGPSCGPEPGCLADSRPFKGVKRRERGRLRRKASGVGHGRTFGLCSHRVETGTAAVHWSFKTFLAFFSAFSAFFSFMDLAGFFFSSFLVSMFLPMTSPPFSNVRGRESARYLPAFRTELSLYSYRTCYKKEQRAGTNVGEFRKSLNPTSKRERVKPSPARA